jgi:hypothetical protein
MLELSARIARFPQTLRIALENQDAIFNGR